MGWSLRNAVLSDKPRNVGAFLFGGFRCSVKINEFPEPFVLIIYESFYQMQKDRLTVKTSTSMSFYVIGMSRIPRLLSRNAMLMLRSVNTARMILVTDKIFISELYGIRLFRYLVNSAWVWKEL